MRAPTLRPAKARFPIQGSLSSCSEAKLAKSQIRQRTKAQHHPNGDDQQFGDIVGPEGFFGAQESRVPLAIMIGLALSTPLSLLRGLSAARRFVTDHVTGV